MNNPICLFCNNPFTGRSDKQYCSPDCKNKYYAKNGFPQKGLKGTATDGNDQPQADPGTPQNAPNMQMVPVVHDMKVHQPSMFGNDVLGMTQYQLYETKQENRELKAELKEKDKRLLELEIAKGTWEAQNTLKEAEAKASLSGNAVETVKDLLFEGVDMAKMYLAKKMGGGDSSEVLGGLDEDSRTLIQGMVENLKELGADQLAVMNLIVEYYAKNPNDRAGWMQQYTVLLNQGKQNNDAAADNNAKQNQPAAKEKANVDIY